MGFLVNESFKHHYLLKMQPKLLIVILKHIRLLTTSTPHFFGNRGMVVIQMRDFIIDELISTRQFCSLFKRLISCVNMRLNKHHIEDGNAQHL